MLIVEKSPKSIIAESYRTLRTNIKYSSFDKDYKTIMITSSEIADGKSTAAANLALAFSQGEDKVLLIDCDLRIPSIHKKFRISNTIGLSDLIVEKLEVKDVAIRYNENLTVITAGKLVPNPSELLSSKAITNFIEEMKEEYDYIILDTPPLMAVTDAQVLSTKVDGTIVVVRYGKSKREDVQNTVKLLQQVNANIIGTLLSRAESKKKEYYYYAYINEASGKERKEIEKKGEEKLEEKLREKEVMI